MAQGLKQKIKFGDKFCPVIGEGNYRLVWNQQIEIENGKPDGQIAARDEHEEKLEFAVDCNRFRIEPGLVHSTYPPAYAEGEYDTHIPQITFMNDSYPWERTCIGKGYPWCILFLFDEADGVEIKSMTIQEAFLQKKDSGNCFVPEIGIKNGEKQTERCTVLDIPRKLFAQVMPEKEELSLLAHIREVSVEDKATHLYVTEGRFASIIGNRLCRRVMGKLLINVHLISLEGYRDFFASTDQADREKMFGDQDKVRVISLTDWKFVSCARSEKNFMQLAVNMDVGHFGQMKLEEEPAQQTVQDMLQLGYRPLNHETREGLRTVSWYKSPLLPYIPAFHTIDTEGNRQNPYLRYQCVNQSDSALAYISDLYMLDAAYAAAWQLGRLLALRNQELLSVLYDIRCKNYEKDSYEKSMQMVREILMKKERRMDSAESGDVFGNMAECFCGMLSDIAEDKGVKNEQNLKMQLRQTEKSGFAGKEE
ncbi:MAG: hypothetical protein K2I96_15700 [Lachnospiraceae bacterium]|nr:hypothetical protein [Lachnospiraceae bacterium]